MTRSYGGGPDRPHRDKEPELREDAPDFDNRLDSLARYRGGGDDTKVQAVRVDFGKRLVAIIIDVAAAYVISMLVNLIPFSGVLAASHLVMVLALLLRDYFFEGRGIGKNLMGLQVVDVKTGMPCTLMQAAKRNIVLYGPPLILFTVALVMGIVNSFVRLPEAISGGIYNVISTVGMLYVIAAIPYEAYRVYSRADGRRFGDQFAGTAVVEAPMDFSTPVPRQ